jgi:hypothetical protein
MANNLPDLCLQNIFNHLEYDSKTLYSCIFVNKQWSYSTIPVLWSKPFHCITNREKRKPLLDIYFSFLPQNQQEEFKIKPKFNSTMFNYPVYFRHMNLSLIYDSVRCWCINSKLIEKTIQLYKALIEYFFIHSSKIDTFEFYESDDINILDIPGSKQVLSKIHTLTIEINDGLKYPILSNLNQYIKSLTFGIPRFNIPLVDSLRQFIQSQKNLIDITITHSLFYYKPNVFPDYRELAQPLLYKSDLFPDYWEIFHTSKNITSTITFIEFNSIGFPRNFSLDSLVYHLSSFTNLQHLKFSGCDSSGIILNKEDQLLQDIDSNYPLAFKKLNTIIITGILLDLDLLKILLQLSGEELRCLELNVKIAKFNYIIKWLEVFCLNLKRLVIMDPSNVNLEIVRIQDFFSKFNNLPYVIINGNILKNTYE